MRAVLFDLDDTLLDHGTASARASAAFHARWRDTLRVPADAFQARWMALTEQGMGAFARGEMGYLEQRRFRMRGMFGEDLADAEADARFSDYLTEYEQHWRLFDDALPCLDALSNIRLAIVTNGAAGTQARKLEALGLRRRFECVVTPTADLPGKPDGRIFARAVEQLGLAPGDCLYVGDQRETDALAACRAGLRGVWLDRSGGNSTGTTPETIHSLLAVPVLRQAR